MRKLFWGFTVLWLLGCYVVLELGGSLDETAAFIYGPHLYNAETGGFQPVLNGEELKAEVEQGRLLSRRFGGVGENEGTTVFYKPEEHGNKAIEDFIQEHEAAWKEERAAALRRRIFTFLFYVVPPIGVALLLFLIHYVRNQRASQSNAR